MKVKFVCNNNANIHSRRSEVFDTVIDLGMEESEWESLDEDAKHEIVMDWAANFLEIYWTEA